MSDPYSMKLPDGFTCADCQSIKRCMMLGVREENSTHVECDWAPSMFRFNIEKAREMRQRLVELEAEVVNVVSKEMLGKTFAVQHNPNCPSAFMVRLPGKSAVIDLKLVTETKDVFGYGHTLVEACKNAVESKKQK